MLSVVPAMLVCASSFAVIAVVSASTSFTFAVPAPLANVTEGGYVGFVLFGDASGPEKSIVLDPA